MSDEHDPTAPALGPLPGFLIIGAMKAGTTSAAANLRRHPGLFMPKNEVHFFDRYWDEGADWYRSFFAEGAGRLCGEKTPRYMTSREYMERIASIVPRAKLVVLLRNPTDRLFSQINHEIQRGRLPATEHVDLAYLNRHILNPPEQFQDYVERGFYARQLEENVFPLFKRKRVFIRSSDGWRESVAEEKLRPTRRSEVELKGMIRHAFTQRLLDELCDFLGVSRWEPKRHRVRHVRVYGVAFSDEAREHVAELYREPNERLLKLLGRETRVREADLA